MATLRKVGAETDMPFVRCREEKSYERRFSWLVGELLYTLVTSDPVSVKVLNLSRVVVDCPFNSFLFILC